MPRHNRRRVDDERVRPTPAGQRRDEWRGEVFVVRSVSATGATKTYRCPGCDQEIHAGVPHVVVWSAGDLDAGGRRHWHGGCWDARENRRPTRR